MTVTMFPPDPADVYERWQQAVQQTNNAGAGGVDPFVPDNTEGGSTGTASTHPLNGGLAAPTGLTVTTGTFYNENFIDVGWTASTNPNVNEYEVELTKTGFGVLPVQRTAGTSIRFRNVDAASQYSVRVRGIANSLSQSTAYVGPQSVTTNADATIPSQVTGVVMTAGMKTVTIRWNENPEEDVKNNQGLYEVYFDTVNTFNSVNFRFVRTPGTVTGFGDLVTGTTYYAKVRAIDSGGNTGPFSGTVSATPTQAGSDDLAANSITANHIQANSINANHVQANTITADKLTTSELTSAIITLAAPSGMLRAGTTASPFNYIVFDRFGIRGFANGTGAYTGGTLTLEFNVNSGGAYFSGTINASTITGGTFRTAASGNRVEIVGASSERISFYSGDGSETAPGRFYSQVVGSGGTRQLYLWTVAPYFGNLRRGEFIAYSASAGNTINAASWMFVRNAGGVPDSQVFVAEDIVLARRTSASGQQMEINSSGIVLLHNLTATVGLGTSSRRMLVNATVNQFVGSDNITKFEVFNDAIKSWRVHSFNDWDIKLRDFADPWHSLVYSGGIDGFYNNSFSRAWIRGNGMQASMYLDGGAMRVLNGDGSAYQNIVALGFIPSSDPKLKKDISESPNALSKIRGIKAYQYRFKTEAADAPLRTGLLATELPAEVQRSQTHSLPKQLLGEDGQMDETKTLSSDVFTGYDVVALLALNSAALSEIATLHDESRNKINEVIRNLPGGAGRPSELPTP